MISEIPGMTERLEGLFLNSMQNGLDGECLVHVARLSNLRRLGIAEMSDLEDDAVMQVLERCPLLEAVNFSETDITDEILRVMSERLSSTLQTAALNRCKNITDVGVRLLVERCRNLQRLGLNWCQLTDKTLQVLGQVAGPKLLSISVARCAMMTPTGFSALFHGCTDLELVDAKSSNVDPQALTMLAAYVKNIKHLALSECHLLTDSTLFQLMTSRAVKKLQYLDISLCMHISDRAFGSIGAWRCPALQYLNLSCLEVTDATLDALLHVTSLVSLDLVSCQFSKTAIMRFFANKPALCRAHLSDIDCLDDELFEWIVNRCKQLSWCSVVGTSVTEERAMRKMEERDWLVVDYELIDEQVHFAM
ncbi:hypothetical protein BC936DRAFT_147725 [Jimgerdemannia flammicorona]|uniref:RNI-like protein n=1 Tax=Jimgerdemannia flammicorona TaxID=994334 RepID=A0A433D4M5_9FUNG|nr:hypothetical protein BC936DRAFT_147725 [Jimgerdemannia flammicorona]